MSSPLYGTFYNGFRECVKRKLKKMRAEIRHSTKKQRLALERQVARDCHKGR